jgi:hypothetical protein
MSNIARKVQLRSSPRWRKVTPVVGEPLRANLADLSEAKFALTGETWINGSHSKDEAWYKVEDSQP